MASKSRTTLAAAVDGYLEGKSSLGVDSIALYRNSVQAFATSCSAKYVEGITQKDITDWCADLKKRGYAPRTIQTRYITLRGFLRAQGVNLDTLMDTAAHRRLARKPQPQTEPYSELEIEQLMAVADPYHRLAFTLLLATGLRYREANHLTWSQVKWDENRIVVLPELVVHHPKRKRVIKFTTKTGRGRMVPLFPSLKAALLEWRKQNPDTVFVLGTRMDLPNNHWLPKLKQFAREAGINCGICEGCATSGDCERVYLHKLRHTFASRCLDRFSIHQVSKWLGHRDLTTTSIYLSGTPKDADCDSFGSMMKEVA